MTTVLLIEDYPDNARLVMRTLQPHGYEVLHAPDAESGIRMALEEAPDIILLDLGLPDLEGETVAAIIKSKPELAHVPLIAVTAWPPDTAAEITKAYGCDGYISKPISPRAFPSQIAAYLTPQQDEEEID
jgi:two-component system cell cycle response regulator DivK